MHLGFADVPSTEILPHPSCWLDKTKLDPKPFWMENEQRSFGFPMLKLRYHKTLSTTFCLLFGCHIPLLHASQCGRLALGFLWSFDHRQGTQTAPLETTSPVARTVVFQGSFSSAVLLPGRCPPHTRQTAQRSLEPVGFRLNPQGSRDAASRFRSQSSHSTNVSRSDWSNNRFKRCFTRLRSSTMLVPKMSFQTKKIVKTDFDEALQPQHA